MCFVGRCLTSALESPIKERLGMLCARKTHNSQDCSEAIDSPKLRERERKLKQAFFSLKR